MCCNPILEQMDAQKKIADIKPAIQINLDNIKRTLRDDGARSASGRYAIRGKLEIRDRRVVAELDRRVNALIALMAWIMDNAKKPEKPANAPLNGFNYDA